MKRNFGFTLVELLITVTVAAILLAIAVPSFTGMLGKNRLVAATENLATSLISAQAESSKRSRTLVAAFKPDTAIGTAEATWCMGIREGSACDCTITDTANASACVIDGALRVVKNTDYPGVTLNATTHFTISPLRNTVTAGNITLQSAQGKQTKIVISGRGRIQKCSPSAAKIGEYAAC